MSKKISKERSYDVSFMEADILVFNCWVRAKNQKEAIKEANEEFQKYMKNFFEIRVNSIKKNKDGSVEYKRLKGR